MAEKITYKDHFDADFEAGIDRLKVKVADLYEEFKKLALEQSKTSLVTKDTAETNKKLADAQAKLIQMETQLATIRKKNLDAHAKLTVEYQKEVAQRNEAIKSARLLAQVVNAENNSAEKLRATIAFLNSEKAKLNLSTADGIKKHEVWTKTVNNLDAKLTGLGTTMQKQQRNVGNYQYNMNGLNFSFAQLTREAPAFANSINTGFMAISNNIPMFVDQINQLRAANKAMNAEGIKTPSVFKSIMGAMFSWQTALSLSITLLTVYGKDIVEWAVNLIKGKDALGELRKEAEKVNEEIVKSSNEWKKINTGSIFDYDSEKSSKQINSLLGDVKRLKSQIQEEMFFDESLGDWVSTGYSIPYEKLSEKQKQSFDKLTRAEVFWIQKRNTVLKQEEEKKRKEDEEKRIKYDEKLIDFQINFYKSTLAIREKYGIDEFQKIQELELKKFNLYERTATEIETMKREQYKDYRKFIESTYTLERKEGAKDFNKIYDIDSKGISTSLGIRSFEDRKKSFVYDEDINKKNAEEDLVAELKILEDRKNALKTAYGEIYDIVSEEQNRMYELAKKKSDLAKSEVDAARDNLQKQKDLRDEGRAYNIIAAQQELDDAIKFQKKKEAEEFKALKRKQALESASQAINLISASASIIRDTAGQPYLYIPLIAAMWIAFAGAKARAYKETKQEFSNGGTGMIGGGSHASGNDTYFGTSNGKRMYAQNGERWAIFNNKASRNPELERWINDINKGSLSLRNNGHMQVNIFDTKNMERGIEKVARNTSEKVYYENGKRIVKQGNTTTYYV